MRVRLRDVAERAGVSVRTVSNVVTGSPHVSPATRERVQAVVDELGYRPNRAARSLRQGRTGTVSLVVPEIDSPYFSELAALVVRRGEALGWQVRIDQTDGDPARERALAGGVEDVDGVVFSPWGVAPRALADLAPQVPVVFLGERSPGGAADAVAVDNVAAAREATTHLLDLGRRSVVALGAQPHLHNGTASLRARGYREALAAHGLGPGREHPVDTLHRADGATAVADLLADGGGLDALFCFSDQLALGAAWELARQGVRVPDDVALVGFDDIEDGRFAVPSLTTVSPDKAAIADLALERLQARIGDPSLPPADLVAPHRLVVRGSTDPAASG